MNIIAVSNYDEMSRRAAELVVAQVQKKPTTLLGLATGSTPVGTYAKMADAQARGEVSYAQCRSVNLDEYMGLGPENPASYRYFMQDKLFNHIDILPENTHLPSGINPDAAGECARYDALIQSLAPIDLQILGLGHNGHIAFNEPDDHFVAGTHVVDLGEATIDANQRFFDRREDVPHQAFTMGMGPLLQAEHLLLLVSGAEKADILYRSLTGPITPQVPGSILQLHGNVTVIADKAALSKFPAGSF